MADPLKADPPKDLTQPPKANGGGSVAASRPEPTQAEVFGAMLARLNAPPVGIHPAGPTAGLDEAVPGGKFIVGGVMVDAHGREVTEDGKLKYPERQTLDPWGRML